MQIVPLIMTIVGMMIAQGGADEFRFYAPGTEQFWSGMLGVPVGLLFAYAGFQLARRGTAALPLVKFATATFLAVVVFVTIFGSMGKLALLLCSLSALIVTLRLREEAALS